jgi:hypothetical protein
VYVDGGYAGRVGELKKFHLQPGSHNIELRDPSGHAFHQEKIQVLPGKTLEIQGALGGVDFDFKFPEMISPDFKL